MDLPSNSQQKIRIQGLTLLKDNNNYQSTKDMSLETPSASTTIISKPEEQNGTLIPFKEWIKANPAEAKQQQKKKNARLVIPVSLDPNDKTNWIGRLTEYWNTSADPGKFEEKIMDLPPPHLFICTVTTKECPNPFGGESYPFLRKKDAKQNAAKLAVQYLVQTGQISEDKISDEPSKSKSSPAQVQKGVPSVPLEEQSYPAQVNHLAHKLGMKSPKYVIELVSDDAVALFNARAYFEDEPLLADEKVVEIEGIWSKKAAKQKCAEEVLKFLQDLEKKRERMMNGEEEVVGEKRKRSVERDSPENLRDERAKELKVDELGGDEEASEYGTPKSGL